MLLIEIGGTSASTVWNDRNQVGVFYEAEGRAIGKGVSSKCLWGLCGGRQQRGAEVSEVDHVAVEPVEGFLQRFAECGVHVYVSGEFERTEVPLRGESQLGQ